MQDETDASLVRRSGQGDRDAFVELMRRHRNSLVSLIRRLVSDLDEAEDLLQETLVHSWLNIASVRNPERVQAWLLQVARNLCRDYHKSAERRTHPTNQPELAEHLNRYGRAAPPNPITMQVREATHSLSPAEREVVQLFYAQGFTIKEICARTQSPPGTVKSRLFTARHHLRSFFGVTDEEERKK
jgi:RNA polymerase sigma factor (sigma-70 family)